MVAVAGLVVALALASVGVPGSAVLARVNGEAITLEEFEEQRTVHFGHGRPLTEDQKLQLLDVLIMEKLLYQDAVARGYIPDEAEVEQELAAELASRGHTIEDLQAELEHRSLCYEEHLQELQKSLAIDRYIDDVVPVPEPTPEEIEEYYRDFIERNPQAGLPDVQWAVIRLRQQALSKHIEELRENAEIQEFPEKLP